MDIAKIYKVLKLIAILVSAIGDGILTEGEIERIEKALREIVGDRWMI